MKHVDQRKARRFIIFSRVTDKDDESLGFVLNISESGLKMAIKKDFHPSKSMDIVIKCPEEATPFQLECTIDILWKQTLSEHFDLIGAEFVHDCDKKSIQWLIEYFKKVSPRLT